MQYLCAPSPWKESRGRQDSSLAFVSQAQTMLVFRSQCVLCPVVKRSEQLSPEGFLSMAAAILTSSSSHRQIREEHGPMVLF